MKSVQCETVQRDLIAYLDGALDNRASESLRQHVEHCEACRAELDWLAAASAALESMGDDLLAQAPDIDVWADVQSELSLANARPKNLAGFASAQRRLQKRVWVFGAVAALAILGLGALLYTLAGSKADIEDGAVAALPTTSASPEKEDLNLFPDGQSMTPVLAELQEILAKIPRDSNKRDAGPTMQETFAPTPAPQLALLTVSDIINLRKAALSDPAARTRLAQLAQIPAEKMRSLVGPEGLSPSAGKYANNPYVRLELAKAGAPVTPNESDADNALLNCIEARQLLAAGNVAEGLSALDKARSATSASTQSLAGAAFAQDALVAAGMAPDAAQTVAALTAGYGESADLLSLSRELLAMSQSYLDQGDLTSAQRISEAVQQLGKQIDAGAALSQERLAGMDIQREAITLLESIYQSLGSTDGIQQLTLDAQFLASGMQGLEDFLNQLDNLFLSASDQVFSTITNIIMQTGDLTIFEHLGS